MTSLRNSISTIMEDTYQVELLEHFFVKNTDLISDILSDIVEERGIDLSDLNNEELFESLLDESLVIAADELNENIIKQAISKVKSLFKRPGQEQSPQLLSPNPKRQAAQTASYFRQNPKRKPSVDIAKQNVKKKVYSGAAAKKNLKSQLSAEHKEALKNYKLSSRRHKDGSVRHYLIHKETGEKIHVATSSKNESGDWGHIKHD